MKSECNFHSLVSTQSCCCTEKQPQLEKYSRKTQVKQDDIQNSSLPIVYRHKSIGPESFINCLLIVFAMCIYINQTSCHYDSICLQSGQKYFKKFQLLPAPKNSLVKSNQMKRMNYRTKENQT